MAPSRTARRHYGSEQHEPQRGQDFGAAVPARFRATISSQSPSRRVSRLQGRLEVRCAERFHDEADLGVEADCGGITLLDALLNQKRMEERQEGGDDAARGFVNVFDIELSCLQTLADKGFEDC